MTLEAFVNLLDFEAPAQAVLNKMVHGYYASGADDEVTLRENRAAFARLRLRPRMLRGVATRDMRITLLGREYATPLMIAPMALQRMAHPDGELGVTRAAAARGIVNVLSTMSSTSLEEVAAVPNALLWFQLYVYKDRAVVRDMVQRAEAAGYQALVLTVDTPLLGKREADIRNAFSVPAGIKAANLKEAYMGNIDAAQGDSALAKYWREILREGGLTWDDVSWLASITKMPLLLKGILRGDDAAMAHAHGAQGVIVSNHGGRQLDTAPASIEVLEEVVQAVEGKVEVLLDGGIRRGTDVLKALALGAKAVLVGRPMLWALAVGGEAGVARALDILLHELDLNMALCGCRTLQDVTRDLVG